MVKKSANLGSLKGMSALGYYLMFEKKKPEEGVKWLMKSAESGNDGT